MQYINDSNAKIQELNLVIIAHNEKVSTLLKPLKIQLNYSVDETVIIQKEGEDEGN